MIRKKKLVEKLKKMNQKLEKIHEEKEKKNMEKFKEVFEKHVFDYKREFICQVCPKPIPRPSKDPNPEVEHEIFTTRQQFLSMCQGNHYQYDQLRRAKHASMMVLYHLHNPNVQAFIHSCNNCQKTIEGEFYRCTEKKCDFDLCKECKKTVPHPHKMELTGGNHSQTSKQR